MLQSYHCRYGRTFILTLVGIPAFIRFYHKAHISANKCIEDVKQHQAKAGTPYYGRNCVFC